MSLLYLSLLSALSALVFQSPSSEKYEIRFIQNGEEVAMVDGQVRLKKESFKIALRLHDHEGVYMSASFGRMYFDLEETDPIPDYPYLGSKTMVEANFNADKLLLIDEETVAYLFYDPSLNWHRLDPDLRVVGNEVFASKTVEQFKDLDAGVTLPISHVNRDIYLFFLATESWDQPEPPKELGRLKIHIQWID